MTINVDAVYSAIMKAGQSAFADNWDEVGSYGETEFKKMAQQIVDIADNVAKYQHDEDQDYSANAGKILMNMQRLAMANVIIALTAMTLVTAQQAINDMLDVVKSTFGGVLKTIL